MHSYYHPLFVRGRPDLAREMRRPQKPSDEGSFSSMTAVLPTASAVPPPASHSRQAPGVLFHGSHCHSPNTEEQVSAYYATLRGDGMLHCATRCDSYGTMRDEPAWNRSSLQESQSSSWDKVHGDTSRTRGPDTPQGLPSGYPSSESSSDIFGGSSGDESDEDFQNLLESTDRLLAAALHAPHGGEAESPDTSPLPMTREETSSMLQSFSFPTPSALPLLQRQPSTEYEGSPHADTLLLPNL